MPPNSALQFLNPNEKSCPFMNLPLLQVTELLDKSGKRASTFMPCVQKGCRFYDDVNNECRADLTMKLIINVFAEVTPDEIKSLVQLAIKHLTK